MCYTNTVCSDWQVLHLRRSILKQRAARPAAPPVELAKWALDRKEWWLLSTSSERPVSHDGAGGEEQRRTQSAGTGSGSGKPARRKKKKRSPAMTVLAVILSFFGWVFKILGTLLLVGVVTGCFVACYGAIYIQSVIMPEAERLDLEAFVLDESTTIYCPDPNTGEYVVIATLSGEENREILETNQIPDVFVNAAIAVEDKRFLQHKGVDWIRTGAAVLYMFTGRDIQGGSTITQQVIKNYTQEDEVTVKRKVLEIFRALAAEEKYTKDDIMTMYLNYIYLGSGQSGIAAASRYYFDKDVSEITLAEAASIIGITNNPSLYNPYSTVETIDEETGQVLTGLERNKKRQELILWLMCYDSHMISEAEYKAAIAQPLNFARGEGEARDVEVRPWLVDQAITETVRYFMDEYGLTLEGANRMVFSGGLHIYTPYNWEIQAAVDEIYTNFENLPYTSSDGQQMQSAIAIVDNSTGYVVAMAGQMGVKEANLLSNYATRSTRQPGSSIKPLAAYSPAIEMGLVTPYSVIDDSPYRLLNGRVWPQNDNRVYRGLMTVQEAITHSTNTVAVKLVGNYVTPENSFNFLQERYGITTLVDHEMINGQLKDDHGESQLALGGLTLGVSPYEMVAAYATFPRGGVYTSPTSVLRVEDRNHAVIWDNTPKDQYPIKESTAHYMNILLTAARSGTGSAAYFNGMHIAGKTGTTSDNFDRWFAGYTPYYTAVVWTGYPYNSRMSTNGNPACVLWRQVMSIIHEGLEDKPFFSVSNLSSYTICLDCGQLAVPACAGDLRGSRAATYSFVQGTQPTGYCTCHVPITICTEAPLHDASGEVIAGTYHYAGEFCPEESVKTVYVVSYERDPSLCGNINIGDQVFMTSFYEMVDEYMPCDVHREPPEDEPDPDDPNYVDPDDPNYVDPNDPGQTDPNDPNSPPPTSSPSDPPAYVDPIDPSNPPVDPTPPASDPPESPSTDPSAPPASETPPAEDYVPVT